MRLVLEKPEIIQVLEKHFKVRLDPENVVIRTDPFEIELSGLPLVEEDTPPKPRRNAMSDPPATVPEPEEDEPTAEAEDDKELVSMRNDRNASAEPPPPGADYMESPSEKGGGIHPAAILEVSRQLEEQLNKENPKLAVQKRGFASRSDEPPTDFKGEV